MHHYEECMCRLLFIFSSPVWREYEHDLVCKSLTRNDKDIGPTGADQVCLVGMEGHAR